MNIPLDEVIFFDAITSTPSTGAAVDADAAPTFAVYEESTDTDIGVGGNMTKRTSLTGNYRGTFTLSAANGFEVGKWYSVIGSGVVGGVTGKAVLKNFRVVAAENTAGFPTTDVSKINNVATTSVTAINANLGTTQPVNFTGTGASALVKIDAIDWASQAIPAPGVTGVPKVDLTHINEVAVTSSTDPIDANLVKVNGTAVGCTLPATGVIASQADVRGVADNVNVSVNVPPVFLRPNSGSTPIRFTVQIRDYTGAMANGDSAPTVDVVTANGTSKNDHLEDSAASPTTTMVGIATGEYELYYAITNGEALDNLRFAITTVKNSITKIYYAMVQVVPQAAIPTDIVSAGAITTSSGAVSLTAAERDAVAAALLDLANAIETGLTLRQAQRLQSAAAAGKLSGAATTTVVLRNAVADSKNRISATVDADGNRSAVTVDLT